MAVLLQSRADGIIENTDLLHNGSRRKRQIPNGWQDNLCSSSPGVGEVPEKSNVRKKEQRQKKQNHITRPPSVTGDYADLVIWLVILRIVSAITTSRWGKSLLLQCRDAALYRQ